MRCSASQTARTSLWRPDDGLTGLIACKTAGSDPVHALNYQF